MANLVRLDGDQVELPHLSLRYSITPPQAILQEGLAASHSLREDSSYQDLPLRQRQEVAGFMAQFGQRLFHMLFPNGQAGELGTRWPLLLQMGAEWNAYPWEWLNDGTRWWALGPGVARFVTPPEPYAGEESPPEEGLRALALSANPLPHREDGELFDHEARLGARFISPPQDLLYQARETPHTWRTVEHASRDDLEQALADPPHLLYFNGFSGGEGWYLESSQWRGQSTGREWLTDRIRQAVGGGLRVAVLNDSQGLLEPMAAAGQAAGLIRAGLKGVIRMEGRQNSQREEAYLGALSENLAKGEPLHAAHLAGVRRLNRRSAPNWDWSFFRLYLRALPRNGTPVSTPAPLASVPLAAMPGAGTLQPTSATRLRPAWPLPTPAPPIFSRRQRVFGRRRELEQLGRALSRDNGAVSPLVFLSGGPGSGKSALAMEAIRRCHREFGQVVCLPVRELLPPPDSLPGMVPGWPAPPPAPMRLVGELIRRMGAFSLLEQPWENWAEGLKEFLSQAAPHLFVVDGLEGQSGYEDFCRLLADFPPSCRLLLLSRAKPPLLAGPVIRLESVGLEELTVMFDESLARRINASPLRGALGELCRRDLLAARLMWRLPNWPHTEAMDTALQQSPPSQPGNETSPGASTNSAMLSLLVGSALQVISREASSVLESLALFSFLAHRDVLGALANLEPRTLSKALAELQWMGLVDCFDGDRYFLLHPRLQGAVARKMITSVAWRRLRSASVRGYQGWLARWASLAATHPRPRILMGWEPAAPPSETSQLRWRHRLGRERTNLVELALALAEEGAWNEIAKLAEAARPLEEVSGMEDVAHLLHRLLLEAGLVKRDKGMQARALNGLAQRLLNRELPKGAQPLLEKALDLLGGGEEWAPLAETYILLSRCYEALGRIEAATNMLHSALELARQLGDSGRLVEAVAGLTAIWRQKEGGAKQAEHFLSEMIGRLEEERKMEPATELQFLLAGLCLTDGRTEEAREFSQGALHAFRAQGAPTGVYRALLRLAECSLTEGEADDGLDLLLQARQCTGANPEEAEEGRILRGVCRKFEAAGRHEDALEGYLLLRKILEDSGDRTGLIALLDTVGGLYFQLGEQAKSTRCYEESLQLKAAVPQ